MWRALVKEPFLQLLLLGAAVFGLYRAVAPQTSDETNPVVVNPELVASVRERFEAQMRRSATDQELVEEIGNEVRQELLYREGQALGFDRDDSIIKQRVAQKVEFLAVDLAQVQSPPIDERAVRSAYERAKAEYVRPKRVSLRQLLFNTDDDAERARERAGLLYERLKSGAIDFEAARAQATPTLLPASLEQADLTELARSYGSEFAKQVLNVTKAGLLPPLGSGFGIHIVEVTRVLPSGPLPFDEAKEDIRLELERRQQAQAERKLYERLRDKYEVRIAPGVELPGLEQRL